MIRLCLLYKKGHISLNIHLSAMGPNFLERIFNFTSRSTFFARLAAILILRQPAKDFLRGCALVNFLLTQHFLSYFGTTLKPW